MDIIDLLKDGYAFNGDPLHSKALDEIERLRHEFRELHRDIKMFMEDDPLKQDLLETIEDVLGEDK